MVNPEEIDKLPQDWEVLLFDSKHWPAAQWQYEDTILEKLLQYMAINPSLKYQ